MRPPVLLRQQPPVFSNNKKVQLIKIQKSYTGTVNMCQKFHAIWRAVYLVLPEEVPSRLQALNYEWN